MITPRPLKENDKVILLSTARKIDVSELREGIEMLESWGLRVEIGKTIGRESNQFAGDDELRAKDLQEALDNPEIRAVFVARGGYGTVRVLDRLDFTSFTKNPKWIIGYSDITALLSHIYYNYSVESIHGIMPFNIDKDSHSSPATNSLRNLLFQNSNTMAFKGDKMNIEGKVSGELVGGNLSVLYSLLASNSFGSTDNKILLLEDLDEYLYHIDRMMYALLRAGKLSNLKAILIGGFTDMHDNAIGFGRTSEEIIFDIISRFGYPAGFSLGFGHIGKDNNALIIGRKTDIVISKEEVIIKQ